MTFSISKETCLAQFEPFRLELKGIMFFQDCLRRCHCCTSQKGLAPTPIEVKSKTPLLSTLEKDLIKTVYPIAFQSPGMVHRR